MLLDRDGRLAPSLERSLVELGHEVSVAACHRAIHSVLVSSLDGVDMLILVGPVGGWLSFLVAIRAAHYSQLAFVISSPPNFRMHDQLRDLDAIWVPRGGFDALRFTRTFHENRRGSATAEDAQPTFAEQGRTGKALLARAAVSNHGGNLHAAARALNIDRSRLKYWLRRAKE